MLPKKKSCQDGRKLLDILSRGPLLPLDFEAIERLIPRADLSVMDRQGNTSLIRAVMNRTCTLRLLSNLLAAGAPVSLANFAGSTALAQASGMGRLEFVIILLSHGADPNFEPKCTSLTPLNQAVLCDTVTSRRAAVVLSLLRAGARTNACNSLGDTPLMSAAKLGREDVVGVLLEACSDLGSSPSINAYNLHALQFRKAAPSRAAKAYMLLFGVPIARAHVACCRNIIIARSSCDLRTVVASPPHLSFSISALFQPPPIPDHEDLPPPPPLVQQQRVRLIAGAASMMFHLICCLAHNTSQPSCSRRVSKALRLSLLMRASCASLPYRIALLQSSAVAAGAADAALALAVATETVKAVLYQPQRCKNNWHKKKRQRSS